MSEPGPAAACSVERECGLEVPFGMIPTLQGRGEHAEKAPGRPKRNDVAEQGVAVRERCEVVVQTRGASDIPEPYASLRKVRHATEPDAVARNAGEVVRGKGLEYRLRLVVPAELGEEHCQAGPPRGAFGHHLPELLEHRCKLAQPSLLASQREHLHAEDPRYTWALEAVAERFCPQRQLLGFFKAAFVKRQHRERPVPYRLQPRL